MGHCKKSSKGHWEPDPLLTKEIQMATMSMRKYRAKLSSLLKNTNRSVAAEICQHLWDDYVQHGMFLHPDLIAADIAIAEGRLVNPPAQLPDEVVTIQPASSIRYLKSSDDIQRTLLSHLNNLKLSKAELKNHKRNALSLCRLFAQYNRNFGRA